MTSRQSSRPRDAHRWSLPVKQRHQGGRSEMKQCRLLPNVHFMKSIFLYSCSSFQKSRCGTHKFGQVQKSLCHGMCVLPSYLSFSWTNRILATPKYRKLYKPRDKIQLILITYADLPSASSLVGQRPFLVMRVETLSASFCSTACRSLSSLLVQSGP